MKKYLKIIYILIVVLFVMVILNFLNKKIGISEYLLPANVLIKNELNKLKEKESPQNKKIIADALQQMKVLDNDYQKIIKEIASNGENKQIIYAMISNLQTRISFLQNVLNQIETTEQLNIRNDEKTL